MIFFLVLERYSLPVCAFLFQNKEIFVEPSLELPLLVCRHVCLLQVPIFVSVTLMFPFHPLSRVGEISKLSGHRKCEDYNYCARMRKVQVGGSQSPNTSFPLSGHTRYPGATGAASELCSCWVSLHPHPYLWTRVISGHRSKHSLHLPLPLLILRCHKKSPYYEPSNLGPATIGI